MDIRNVSTYFIGSDESYKVKLLDNLVMILDIDENESLIATMHQNSTYYQFDTYLKMTYPLNKALIAVEEKDSEGIPISVSIKYPNHTLIFNIDIKSIQQKIDDFENTCT